MFEPTDVALAGKGTTDSISKVGKGVFPDPWCDIASTAAPKTLKDVLEWSEFYWITNGTYRMACERVVSYFITKLEVLDVNDEVASKYKDYFTDSLKYVDTLRLLGNDMQCYGNSFSSLFFPFDRYLECPKCALSRPIEKVSYEWTKEFTFTGVCPSCKHKGEFIRKDRKSNSTTKAKVIRWSPHDIVIQFNPLSHDCEYRLRVDAELKKLIKDGNDFYLRTTPWEFIQTIKEDKLFRFHANAIFHMKEDTVGGIKSKGWGIPRFISNFKQAYYIQVVKRYNEALALDYIVPFRVITPQPGSSKVGDPLLHQNLATNKNQVTNMLHEHRRDPASWHFLPFPMNYEVLGGEGLQMGGHELINAATDELLNAQGIPAELYRGSLSVQAAPMALRLFQQTWPHLVSAYSDWLGWAAEKIASNENWEPAKLSLQQVTLADDLEKKQILLQLASAKVVSQQTALSPFGVDAEDENRRIYDEQRQQQEMEREFQTEEEARAKLEEQLNQATQAQEAPAGPGAPPMMGGAPAGGAMPGMPGGAGANPAGTGTPQDMMLQAEEMAMQLLQMPDPDRRSQLIDLKHSNETLHAMVSQKIEDLRNDAQQQGGRMLLEQGGMPQ